MWSRITNTIDLYGATPHILRHSYLTYAVGATADFKTIRGISSGHVDIFTLLNTYAHPQKDKVQELSAEMAKILTRMQIFADAFYPLCHKALRDVSRSQNVDFTHISRHKKTQEP